MNNSNFCEKIATEIRSQNLNKNKLHQMFNFDEDWQM